MWFILGKSKKINCKTGFKNKRSEQIIDNKKSLENNENLKI